MMAFLDPDSDTKPRYRTLLKMLKKLGLLPSSQLSYDKNLPAVMLTLIPI